MQSTAFQNLRKEKGVSLREVSRQTGISNGYLSEIERGTHQAGLYTLEKLAEYFDVDVTVFFEEEGEVSQEVKANMYLKSLIRRKCTNLDNEQLKEIVSYIDFITSNESESTEE